MLSLLLDKRLLMPLIILIIVFAALEFQYHRGYAAGTAEEKERRECHVFDIEEFGTKLYSLEFEDGEEIPLDEFEDYLDYNLESAAIIQDFGKFFYSMRYEISIAYEEGEIE